MLGIFAVAAAASQSFPPPIATTNVAPPPIVAVTPSPPAVLTPVPPAKPFLVDVIVSGEGKTLWRGSLRVARGWGANVTETVSQTPPAICPGISRYDGDFRNMIAFHIRSNDMAQEMVNVSVNWQRPAADWSCEKTSLRTVQIGQSVRLEAGKPVTVEGDAGLKMILTRR